LWADVVAGTLHRVRDGFQALPLELARRFQDAGGDVLQPYRLRTLDRAEDGRLWLVFERGTDRQEWTCTAEHVVLALPQRSLQLLDPHAVLFANQQFRADLDGLVPQVAMKAFLAYGGPWWTESLGLQSGPSVTDLPLRQCLYFETEGDQAGADPDNRNSLLLASYDAGNGVDFWRGLPGRPLFPAMATHIAGAPNADASHLLVDELQRELQLLHGPAVQVPAPYVALFMDWGQDPFGAGWHFWPIGAKSWEVIPRVRQPVADAKIYVCGEAWSTTQGWVEGALQTAEQVLRQKFGLPGPDWLPTDAHLGP
jgi:monoamine oxidase